MERNTFTKIVGVIALSSLAIFGAQAAEPKPDTQPVKVVKLLSAHATKAVFKGITVHKCMGRTALCPDQCGHSGRIATFAIQSYTNYAKPGEYGDAKQQTFSVQLNEKSLSKAALDTIGTLKTGDVVTLHWNHNYISETFADGTQANFPQRDVVKLEKSKE